MRIPVLSLVLVCLLTLATPALAHFGMVLPDANEITPEGSKTVSLQFLFWHPMEGTGMDLAKPKIEVRTGGKKLDLTGALKEGKKDGHAVWSAGHQPTEPGVYVYSMIPQPYWEPAEDCFIVHYAKTYVSVLGAEEGWDKPVGTKIEIIPLTKPFGLWAGAAFTGKVVLNGKPLADADVEMEFWNEGGKVKAPSGAYLSQVVKTASNGTFTVALPWAGWWGLAALGEDDVKLKHDGQPRKVEIGGVLWLYAHEAPGRQ